MKSYKKYMQEMGQNGSKTLEQVFFRSVSDARTPTNDKNSISNFLIFVKPTGPARLHEKLNWWRGPNSSYFPEIIQHLKNIVGSHICVTLPPCKRSKF